MPNVSRVVNRRQRPKTAAEVCQGFHEKSRRTQGHTLKYLKGSSTSGRSNETILDLTPGNHYLKLTQLDSTLGSVSVQKIR